MDKRIRVYRNTYMTLFEELLCCLIVIVRLNKTPTSIFILVHIHHVNVEVNLFAIFFIVYTIPH